jgi:hypothetical protein
VVGEKKPENKPVRKEKENVLAHAEVDTEGFRSIEGGRRG